MMMFICFAAYNEAENIPGLLQRIAEHMGNQLYQVVAFDDGSTDATYPVLKEMQARYPLTVLHEDINKGLAKGLTALINHICEHGADSDIAVFMDGDDTHDPSTITAMKQALEKGADVAIASRYCPGSAVTGLPWQRRALSLCASAFWQGMIGLPGVEDYTSGYRAYRIGSLKAARKACNNTLITRRGFDCQVELLYRLRDVAAFREVPIRLAYERKQGASKMRVMRTIVQTLSFGCRLWCTKKMGKYWA